MDHLAEKMIEIFADSERLEKFQGRSYEIAEKFSTQNIEDKWRELVREILR